MDRLDIDELLSKTIQEYEEIDTSFNKLLISKMYNKHLVVIYDDEKKLEFLRRYLIECKVEIYNSIKIEDLFHIHREMDKMNQIERYISNKEYIVISMIDFKKSWLNKIIKKLKHPYYFFMYARYIKIKRIVDDIEYFEPSFYRERGQQLYDYVVNYKDQLTHLYDELADDLSRDTLKEIISVGVLNRAWQTSQGSQFDKYWDCYRHLEDECWVNCGSASGDTIVKYLYKNYQFQKIYAYEGESVVFKELREVMSIIPDKITNKIEFVNKFIGINDSSDNFDHIFSEKRVTLINMDIEGAEMSVLRGSAEIIKKQRPVLAICAYHKPSDLLDIPKFINDTVDHYNVFLRKYVGGMPQALNEYVYYCVPNERCVD